RGGRRSRDRDLVPRDRLTRHPYARWGAPHGAPHRMRAPECRIWGLDLSLAVIAFLVFAVLLPLGILLAVALPQLRAPRDDEQAARAADRRHSSRTGR